MKSSLNESTNKLIRSARSIRSQYEVNTRANMILTHIHRLCDVPRTLILSKSRKNDAVIGRFALYATLRNAGATLYQIGDSVGKDHSSILKALQRMTPARITKSELNEYPLSQVLRFLSKENTKLTTKFILNNTNLGEKEQN